MTIYQHHEDHLPSHQLRKEGYEPIKDQSTADVESIVLKQPHEENYSSKSFSSPYLRRDASTCCSTQTNSTFSSSSSSKLDLLRARTKKLRSITSQKIEDVRQSLISDIESNSNDYKACMNTTSSSVWSDSHYSPPIQHHHHTTTTMIPPKEVVLHEEDEGIAFSISNDDGCKMIPHQYDDESSNKYYLQNEIRALQKEIEKKDEELEILRRQVEDGGGGCFQARIIITQLTTIILVLVTSLGVLITWK